MTSEVTFAMFELYLGNAVLLAAIQIPELRSVTAAKGYNH
jgi:hypothetical protein